MGLLQKLMVPLFIMASTIQVYAQIKNAQTITVPVSGNCGMCKAVIEKAGNLKKQAKVEWGRDNQAATITYDPRKTSPETVLKRIALAGYDNEKYLAPQEAYNSLSGCCQYERSSLAAKKDLGESYSENISQKSAINQTSIKKETAATNVLAEVFSRYFILQKALVKSDAQQVASSAGELQYAIADVPMSALGIEAHTTWMEVNEKLARDAKAIASSDDLNKQRVLFASISLNMHILAKVACLREPIYYNNCPMFKNGQGANWLSDQKEIKNPYYGSQMLTCGKTIEIIE